MGVNGANERILVDVDAGTYNVRKGTCWYGCTSCSGAVSISVSSTFINFSQGTQQQLQILQNTDTGSTYNYFGAMNWSSSDTGVATISSPYGMGTGVNLGNYTASAFTSNMPIYNANWCAYNVSCPASGYMSGSGPGTVAQASVSCSAAIRGGIITCTTSGSAGVTFNNWQFTDGTNVVTSATGSTATTWTGVAVANGSVSVQASAGGSVSSPNNGAFSVLPRSFHTTAPAPIQSANGTNGLPFLPSPPVRGADAGLGFYNSPISVGETASSAVPSGPNTGYLYIQSGVIETFVYYYLIHPDLENSASDFYLHQTGSFDASSHPGGTISGAVLLTQTRRHEYNSTSPTLSHYGKFITSLSANNPGDYLESAIAPPASDQNAFNTNVSNGLFALANQIRADTVVEPLDINVDDAGVHDGNVCYPPYDDPASCN